MTDTNIFFKDLGAEAKNLAANLERINSNLRHYKIAEFDGKSTNSIAAFFKVEPQGYGICSVIDDYINHTIRVSKKLDEFRSDINNHWHVEHQKELALQAAQLMHEKAKRKSERSDMWALWCQQTIRWIGGAILALVMYSGAIWLSENCKFIHVPTKDWFAKAAEQPKP